MKDILKNTIPSILLMWFIYFTELLNMDFVDILDIEKIVLTTDSSSLLFTYYYQNLIIFILYTIAGFTFGIISSIILYEKRKRKFSLLSKSDEKYSIYFLKSSLSSFVILFSLLLREIINQPSLFQTTLLNENFLFYPIINFFYSFFSPLYFTSILVFIISFFFYKLMKIMDIEETISKIATYLISILILILLLFNYGFLNADNNLKNEDKKVLTNNEGKYNLLMIGVEGLEQKYFVKGVSDKYLFENFRGFHDIKLRSYNFQNCYTTSTEMIPSLISSISGLHPDYSEYRFKYPFIKEEILHDEKYNNYFEKLRNDFNYNVLIAGENEFKYLKSYLEEKNSALFNSYNKKTDFKIQFPKFSNRSNLLASIIIKHPFFISFISNTFMLNQFEEITSSKFYMNKRYSRKDVIEFMTKNSSIKNSKLIDSNNEKFAILYLISKKDGIKLPYPYDSMTDTKGKIDRNRNYTKYVDEELQIIIEKLKQNNQYEETIIVLFGIPNSKIFNKSNNNGKENLLVKNLKIPLLISSPDYEKEKFVKRNYSNLDIYPTSFELVTGHSLRDKIDGISLLDTVFTRRDIFISERFEDLVRRIGIPQNKLNHSDSSSIKFNNLLISKKSKNISEDENNGDYVFNDLKYINNSYKSLLSSFSKRAYIRGDYKLNIYPKSEYIEYELFDIKSDPWERKNIAEEKKRILDRMISRMHDKYKKRFNYSFINGYFIKQ